MASDVTVSVSKDSSAGLLDGDHDHSLVWRRPWTQPCLKVSQRRIATRVSQSQSWRALLGEHRSCGTLPTLVEGRNSNGRYVPWQLGRLDRCDLLARGCMPAHKNCEKNLPAGRPKQAVAVPADSSEFTSCKICIASIQVDLISPNIPLSRPISVSGFPTNLSWDPAQHVYFSERLHTGWSIQCSTQNRVKRCCLFCNFKFWMSQTYVIFVVQIRMEAVYSEYLCQLRIESSQSSGVTPVAGLNLLR